MSKAKVRRFQMVEVIYHTLQGVLYLLLFFTGSLLLLQRTFEFEWIAARKLSSMHRIMGVVFVVFLVQCSILAIFSTHFRKLWHSIKEAFCWKRRDFIWLLKMPLHVLFHRIQLPPAERFNAGQKLHLLVVGSVLVGFSVSGILMILIPGALIPWMVHLICYVPAMLFLGIHLFLSLLNPPTNKAIGGMISGYVSETYAREHHSLWLGHKESSHHTVHIYRWPVFILFLVFLGFLVLLINRYDYHRFTNQCAKVIQSKGSLLILPARLTLSHDMDPDAKNCFSCHLYWSSPASEKCLKCHQNISQAMDQQAGYHGKLVGLCRDCHKEHQGLLADIHPLNKEEFNHQLARFHLEGVHENISCLKCHEHDLSGESESLMGSASVIRYMGIKFDTCVSCHSDPHQDERSSDCLQCHTMNGWKRNNLKFVHDRDSHFLLEGRHSTIPCEKCHVTQKEKEAITMVKLYDVGETCGDCHEDPHHRQFPRTCSTCHSEENWKEPLLYDAHGHSSSYPLVGKHNSVACQNCHQLPHSKAKLAEAQFVNLSTQCVDCHEDPHRGQFKNSCDQCHTEFGWKEPWLKDPHGLDSSFPLKGKHQQVPCEKCHLQPENQAKFAEAWFVNISHDCQSCHNDPHEKQMSASCDICHVENGWKDKYLLFSHDKHSSFKLDKMHNKFSCQSCHTGEKSVVYRPLPQTCETCHANEADYMKGIVTSVQDKPDPHYNRITCTDCHNTNIVSPNNSAYADRCASCHTTYYQELYYEWSSSWHDNKKNAEKIVEKLAENNTVGKIKLEKYIQEATKVNFHNISLSQKLWNSILDDPNN